MSSDSPSSESNAQSSSRLEDIFDHARSLESDVRTSFLDSACGADAKLRKELDVLLAAHDSAPSFMERPGVEVLLDSDTDAGKMIAQGRAIGAYTVLGLIATGGIGAVYEAQQQRPNRRVALKVLRLALSSSVMRRRFRDEAEILGRLRHPHIAQIYEAGSFEDSGEHIPFFAMELISNAQPITEFARSQNLDIQSKIELVVQVCDAVHHGHMRGIIHRDLKPGNILVDERVLPKVIDFGIARATDADVAVTTRRTGVGELIGTLPYMSPEQCDADPGELDIRTDVYSLGVVLFQLLTGHLPHDLSKTSIVGAIQVIRGHPVKCLSEYDKSLRGDLETIVATAMSKDRTQRYPSTAEVAQDLRRYARNEPISARPPSTVYVVRKFVSRHRGIVAGFCVAALGLVVGAAAASWQAIEATSERDRALNAEHRASIEAQKAGRINGFLQRMLASANPVESSGDVSVRSVLEEAARQIDEELGDEPEIAGPLKRTIGASYRGLALYEEAEVYINDAVRLAVTTYGEDHLDVAIAQNELAMLYKEIGQDEEAERLLHKALDNFKRNVGENSSEVAATLAELGLLYYDRVQYDQAEPYLRDSLRITRELHGDDDIRTAHGHNNLAMLLRVTRQFGNAERHYREALRIKRSLLGERHIETASTLNNLAGSLGVRNPAAAETMYREVISIMRVVFEGDHTRVATSVDNLGLVLTNQGKYEEAEPVILDALAMRRRLFPGDHAHVAASLLNLGQLHMLAGKPEKAEPHLRESVEMRRRIMPEGSWYVATIESLHGDCLTSLGRFDDAEPLLLNSYRRVVTEFGEHHQYSIAIARRIEGLYAAWGKPDATATFLESNPLETGP